MLLRSIVRSWFWPIKKLALRLFGIVARASPWKFKSFGYPDKLVKKPLWLQEPGVERPCYVTNVVLLHARPKQTRVLPLKASSKDAPLWAELADWQPKQRFVVEIADARICRSLTIVGSQNEILWDLSPLWNVEPERHPCLLAPVFFSEKKLKGRYLFLSVDSSQNYFHWMLDLLPKILVLEEAGYSLQDFDGILVDALKDAYQKESLQAMGMPLKKIIETSRIHLLEVDSLVVPSWAEQSSFYHREDLAMLAERLQKGCQVGQNIQISKPSRRIYIDRSNQWGRCLRRRTEILAVFNKYQIEVVNLDGKSLAEQIELFSSVAWVVGIHGASMTNLLFCRPGTKVLELIHPKWAWFMYWAVAAALDLKYYYLLSDNTDGIDSENEEIKKRLADITVSPDILDGLFQKWDAGAA